MVQTDNIIRRMRFASCINKARIQTRPYNRYSYFKFYEVLIGLYFDRLDGLVLINDLVCQWNGECNGFEQQLQG